MIKKDLAFFILILFSLAVFVVNVALIVICALAIVKMADYSILTLNPYRIYAISLIVVDAVYLFVLVFYLLLRKKK